MILYASCREEQMKILRFEKTFKNMKKVLDKLKSTRYNRQAVTKKRKFLGEKKKLKKF